MKAIVCNQCKKIIEENIYHLEIRKPFGIDVKPPQIIYDYNGESHDSLDFCCVDCMINSFKKSGGKRK